MKNVEDMAILFLLRLNIKLVSSPNFFYAFIFCYDAAIKYTNAYMILADGSLRGVD